ncbi:uncharacterized protein LOC124454466 [Xenia sp. Carnegie-2017]|uniref:uncharacterized protein LOC124454466 n=1 Tax=Xenia sp. Carnegie-2017 TaxID=2897299 RepID=UPI001F04D26E|nr:uncharacterized protein LOC124454466 [Xenia sp. Carnegie-2017]
MDSTCSYWSTTLFGSDHLQIWTTRALIGRRPCLDRIIYKYGQHVLLLVDDPVWIGSSTNMDNTCSYWLTTLFGSDHLQIWTTHALIGRRPCLDRIIYKYGQHVLLLVDDPVWIGSSTNMDNTCSYWSTTLFGSDHLQIWTTRALISRRPCLDRIIYKYGQHVLLLVDDPVWIGSSTNMDNTCSYWSTTLFGSDHLQIWTTHALIGRRPCLDRIIYKYGQHVLLLVDDPVCIGSSTPETSSNS